MARTKKKGKFAPKNKSSQRAGEKPKPANDKTNLNDRASNPSTSTSASSSSSASSRHNDALLPLPFPSSLPFPSNDFLRDEEPYKESFQAACATSYQGFVVDETVDDEVAVQSALQSMVAKNYFRTDVTQPFGLGTKCAKTYVTRCLLGEPGTTYKYLGLRMFAHPWKDTKIHSLAQTLSDRTKTHLKELDDIRRQRNAPPTRGRSVFDICLINRMEASDELKPEPTMGGGKNNNNNNNNNAHKTSVSWHADSSLEHFSTIAVYQTIVPSSSSSSSSSDNPKSKTKQSKKSNKNHNNSNTETKHKNDHWFVALRVAHNSEGPAASRRGTDINSSIIKETPPIAANLPSGSAYYLLDDFNHHHQHTVLTDAKERSDFDAAGVRYSCTYRLLRDSHSVDHILARCKTACSNFHKKGSKIWRSEQLLLSEMESEWLRQFYIQGSQHYEILWSSWGEPMKQLIRYWSQLEGRTKQVIDFLRSAAEERCHKEGEASSTGQAPSRTERKARERRRKALASMEELLERGNIGNYDVLESVYEPMSELLEERAGMRELWAKREQDHVFRELAKEYRPMEFPVTYGRPADSHVKEGCGVSPLTGSPQELQRIAASLRALGKAYMSRNPTDLPELAKPNEQKAGEGNHAKTLEWPGWDQFEFGLELQEPWAGAVVDGRKPIETRAYDLPPSLLGKRIHIIQSPAGKAGVSAMGDVIDLKSDGAKVIGWCVISSVKKYTSREEFEQDESEHLVSKDSGYGWKDGKTKIIYGWKVEECGTLKSNGDGSYHTAVRRMRSLFQLKKHQDQQQNEKRSHQQDQKARSKNNKKRRKRY